MPNHSTLLLEMPNDLAALPPVVEALVARLEEHGASSGAVFAANLALEELVTNIIKYGYGDEATPTAHATHTIQIELRVSDGAFTLCVIDDGHEFDPFLKAAPDTSAPIEERLIGGLGIHFIRNLLDTCHYERRDGRNKVSVSKALHPPPEP